MDMAASELNHYYDPLMMCLKVVVKRNGYSAASWVNGLEDIGNMRERLEAAINRMEADTAIPPG